MGAACSYPECEAEGIYSVLVVPEGPAGLAKTRLSTFLCEKHYNALASNLKEKHPDESPVCRVEVAKRAEQAPFGKWTGWTGAQTVGLCGKCLSGLSFTQAERTLLGI